MELGVKMSQEKGRFSTYNRLLEQAKAAATETARTWIPKLCKALKEAEKNLTNEGIRDRVEEDCAWIWSRNTIRNCIPDEYKDKQKQEAGKKGRQKQLLDPILAGGAHETGAENCSFSPAEQKSWSSESERRAVEKLKTKLREKEEELKKLVEERKTLLEQQDQGCNPLTVVTDRVGVIKKESPAKISGKAGFGVLAGQCGEVIRRHLEKNNGKATARFYINTKNPSDGIEYLLPVGFTVDFDGRRTELVLDERRV